MQTLGLIERAIRWYLRVGYYCDETPQSVQQIPLFLALECQDSVVHYNTQLQMQQILKGEVPVSQMGNRAPGAYYLLKKSHYHEEIYFNSSFNIYSSNTVYQDLYQYYEHIGGNTAGVCGVYV